jgi:hypothetical protein
MTRISPAPHTARCGRLLLATLLLSGAACTSGITQDGQTQKLLEGCPQPVQGARYSLCGRLTTSGLGGPGQAWQVMGSVDSAPAPAGSHYTIQEGTFHGAR